MSKIAVFVNGENVFEAVAGATKTGKTLYAGGKAFLSGVTATSVVKVMVTDGDGEKEKLVGVGTARFVAKGEKKDNAGATVKAKVNAYVTAGPARVNVTFIGSDGATTVPDAGDVQVGCNISL